MSEKKAKDSEMQKSDGQAAAPGKPSPAAAPALNKIIAFIPISRTAQEVLKVISEKKIAEVIYTDTAEGTVEASKQNLPCMLFLSIANNTEVTSRYQVFNKLDSAIEQQGLKVFTVTPLKSQKLSFLFFKRFGVTEYVLEPQTARAMQFKATQLLKSLDTFRREEAERAQQPTATVKRKAASALGQDIFLIKGSGMKKTGKNWVVDVEGPDPSSGDWVQHNDPGDPKTAWRWVPNAEKEAQASGEKPKNGWVLTGNKPTYNPETGKWALSSETPSLALHENGKATAEKISQDEKGDIIIADDSPPPRELRATEGRVPESKELSASEGKAEDKPNLEALLEAPKPGSPRKLQLKKQAEEKGSEFNDKRGKDPEARGVNDKRGSEQETATPFNDHTGGGKEEGKAAPKDLAEGKTESSQKNLVNKFGKDPGPKGVNPLNAGKDEEPKAAKDFVDQKGPESAMKEARVSDPKASGKDYHGKEDAPESKELSAAEAKAIAAGAKPLKLKNPPQEAPADSAESSPAGKEASVKTEGPSAAEGTPAASSSKENVDKKTQAGKLRTKMKEHLDEISKRLAVPLTDKMNMVEEDEIRGELGLRDRPEIKVKELSLKKRNADVKAMRAAHAKLKQELDGLEQQIAKQDKPYDSSAQQAAAAAEVMQFKNDAPKAMGVNSSKSFEGESQQDSAEGSKGKESKEKAERDSTGSGEDFQYVPESGIKPQGNAWDKAPPYYLYLDAKIRYQGFKDLKELLPLWIFKGSQVPELLDRTKQWRFKGALPIQASKVEEIPAEVREFLDGLNKDLKNGKATGSEFVASPDAGTAETSGTSDASGTPAASSASAISEKPPEALVETSPVPGASADLQASADTAENPSPGTGDAPAASAEKPADQAEKPAPLRLVKNDEGSEKSGEKDDFVAVQKTYVEKLEGRNDLKSDAVKKFLDRQKERKDEPAAKKNEAKTASAPKLRLVSPPEEKSVFLGLFVAISDSFTPGKTTQASMERILNSMETSFGECFVAYTGKPEAEQKAKILFRSRSTPGTEKTVVLSSGLCVPVERVNGATKNVVGYLFLMKTGNRKGFDSMEESTVKEVAEKIWPLLELSDEEQQPA